MMTTDSIDTAAPPQQRSIPDVVAGVRRAFAAGRTRPVEWRRAQLKALSAMVRENETRIAEALGRTRRSRASRAGTRWMAMPSVKTAWTAAATTRLV